ncbi:MAG: ABC transporter ATP-binding protein [Opitutaceae bacterium]
MTPHPAPQPLSGTVEVTDISKSYLQGKIRVKALDGVSLSFARGEFAALVGPSGSGKTTLLNVIGGLDTPDSGQIDLSGRRLDQLSPAAVTRIRLKDIGFVFQAYNLIPVLSALENVEYIMLLQGVTRSERHERAKRILDEVGLEGLHDRRPAEMSGGQQQRVAVARAIVSHPTIVLADEPTANLDSETAKELLDLMLHLNRSHDVTFVFATHDELVMNAPGESFACAMAGWWPTNARSERDPTNSGTIGPSLPSGGGSDPNRHPRSAPPGGSACHLGIRLLRQGRSPYRAGRQRFLLECLRRQRPGRPGGDRPMDDHGGIRARDP